MNDYCGKCWETRGTVVELIRVDHERVRDLPKVEQREHLRARCQPHILLCPYCRSERHPGQQYETVHRHWHRVKGQMVEVFVPRRYPEVVDEKAVLKAAA